MYDFTNQYGLFVIVNGNRVTEYNHTDGNTYIEGRKGSEYELELVNDSNERVMMIPSVDGLSVCDGKPAGLDSSGYIVDAKSRVRIPGWRLNQNQAAKFVFGCAKQSYTARNGYGTKNIGALGVLVFRESHDSVSRRDSWGSWGSWVDHPQHPDFNKNRPIWLGSSSTCSTTLRNTPSFGTGFGEAKDFKSTEDVFKKRHPNYPDAMIVMYYDSAKGLEKKGIVLSYKTVSKPLAFPEYKSRITGCTPPPGWDSDRDSVINNLLSRIDNGEKKDKMYEMLRVVETSKLEEAFNTFSKFLN